MTKSDAAQTTKNMTSSPSTLNHLDGLQQYLKSNAGARQGRAIPPLADWHPTQIVDMDLAIKANGEWWHEGSKMTRESLVSLFATVLWHEKKDGVSEYFLKTPVQLLRIQVEDVPLFINDVSIVIENEISWLEFTTTTGDVVRLDEAHQISLRAYSPSKEHVKEHVSEGHIKKEHSSENSAAQIKRDESEIRPYMPVRQGLMALIGRNTFYHLTEIGKFSEQNGTTILTLSSGGHDYTVTMPID